MRESKESSSRERVRVRIEGGGSRAKGCWRPGGGQGSSQKRGVPSIRPGKWSEKIFLLYSIGVIYCFLL